MQYIKKCYSTRYCLFNNNKSIPTNHTSLYLNK